MLAGETLEHMMSCDPALRFVDIAELFGVGLPRLGRGLAPAV